MEVSGTIVTTTPRPKKPRPTPPHEPFELTWHSRGYWVKRWRGRELRFTADATQSLEMWRDVLERDRAGERAPIRQRFTLRNAVNVYLTRQKQRFEDGELSQVQFTKCRYELEKRLPLAVALSTPLTDLNADNPNDPRPGHVFGRIRAKAIRRGLQAAHRHIVIVRAMLEQAARRHLMRAPDYGDFFDPPSQSAIDRQRNARDVESGPRAWTVDELRKILLEAERLTTCRKTSKGDKPPRNPHLYAQILLGLFAAFGSDDCSALPESALLQDKGVHTFPRVKNQRPRCAYLPARVWAAIDASRAARVPPATADAKGLVFRTSNGTRCNAAKTESDHVGLKTVGRNDTIGKNFQRLVKRLELERARAGFKTLRAMCRTMLVGANVSDDVINAIMGRRFRHRVDEFYLRGDLRAELVKAARHIERQLFPVKRTRSPRRARRNASAARAPSSPHH